MARGNYKDENGRINLNSLESDLNYYKGFYDGVKEILPLLKGDETPNEINVELRRLEGKESENFIKMIKKIERNIPGGNNNE